MTTIEAIQQLPDGQFHRLCDALLPRIETRYRRLRSHGINARNESIRGQPDSYVGESAEMCEIAFCYTVQRKSWWTKLIEDVQLALKAAPGAGEIVVALPRDVDREGPAKGKHVDWLGNAKREAGAAQLRVLDVREIAALLDSDHQDLRFEHLHIPYSRLTAQTVLASCQRANERVMEALIASGRYDPARYFTRASDRELFELWQHAINAGTGARLVRLIPLVNDSGVGKTSLLAAFTRSLGTLLPSLLIQAKDVGFASEDSLVAYVVQTLQGVLAPGGRANEEAAISRLLTRDRPLTVVLDGIDETKDPSSVQRAITCWLRSEIGQKSILIVSSRPEFWMLCSDQGWRKHLPDSERNARLPATPSARIAREAADPMTGIQLPDRFSEDELSKAWVRGGQALDGLFRLLPESREELRHPFTLRVYLDLLAAGAALPEPVTRADILEQWLDHRLRLESSAPERLTQNQLRQALRVVARRLAENRQASVQVDDLAEVPRFNPSKPAGPVVERLLAANILESVPGHPDCLRFAVEAVQDFFLAEAEIEDIIQAPEAVVERFLSLSFSEAHPRLARIGKMLSSEECRHRFVSRLAESDSFKAAVLLRAAPLQYETAVRQKVVDSLGGEISSRYRVRAGAAIHLLGDINSPESMTCLAIFLLRPPQVNPYLKAAGAFAFLRLGCPAASRLIYETNWFALLSGGEAYYFKEWLGLVRGTSEELKGALATRAITDLNAASGTPQHGRAVCVLAYLRDDRLVPHLERRLTANGRLYEYENHALVAVGSPAAGGVFYASAMSTAEQMATLSYDDGGMARYQLQSAVCSKYADFHYLLGEGFDECIARLLQETGTEATFMGIDLAKDSWRPALIYLAIQAEVRLNSHSSFERASDGFLPEDWLSWWKQSKDDALRRRLLTYIPHVANSEIEGVLLECLDSLELRGLAIIALGKIGSCRACAFLRGLVSDPSAALHPWELAEVAEALGSLRDESAVDVLATLARQNSSGVTALHAIHSLGFIGTREAEEALQGLLGGETDEQSVASALVACGTSSAVNLVIERAKAKPSGAAWLLRTIRKTFWLRGHRYGEYYTHIDTRPITDYLRQNENELEECASDLVGSLDRIDSADVRALLRHWAQNRGSDMDPIIRDQDQYRLSSAVYLDLERRGDDFAIPYFLDYRADSDDLAYLSLAEDHLGQFSPAAVAKELKARLGQTQARREILRYLRLLGQFGGREDHEIIRSFLTHADREIADVACEAFLRLTDPLLIPPEWKVI